MVTLILLYYFLPFLFTVLLHYIFCFINSASIQDPGPVSVDLQCSGSFSCIPRSQRIQAHTFSSRGLVTKLPRCPPLDTLDNHHYVSRIRATRNMSKQMAATTQLG